MGTANTRYFVDSTGRHVYLTGSHYWESLQDVASGFDYEAYLDVLVAHHHNFVRLWTWETTAREVAGWLRDPLPEGYPLQPRLFVRTGPVPALDGEPKFDLTILDDAYFRRLRQRVAAAAERGIYVSVMLFQGFSVSVQFNWAAHPFNRANNVNGIDGDGDSNGTGDEIHPAPAPAVEALQRAYVRRVVDTLQDLDDGAK